MLTVLTQNYFLTDGHGDLRWMSKLYKLLLKSWDVSFIYPEEDALSLCL